MCVTHCGICSAAVTRPLGISTRHVYCSRRFCLRIVAALPAATGCSLLLFFFLFSSISFLSFLPFLFSFFPSFPPLFPYVSHGNSAAERPPGTTQTEDLIYSNTAMFETWALEFLDRILSLMKTQVSLLISRPQHAAACLNLPISNIPRTVAPLVTSRKPSTHTLTANPANHRHATPYAVKKKVACTNLCICPERRALFSLTTSFLFSFTVSSFPSLTTSSSHN